MPRVCFFFLICLFVFTAGAASAQSRRPPLKFELTAVDPDTQRPRTTFVLGEAVIVRMSLTNQSRVPRTVAQLPDTTIDLRLSSLLDYEAGPTSQDSYIGGTGYSQQVSPTFVSWGSRPPRMVTIAPGQTISKTFDVGRHLWPLQAGTHTLTAKYNSSLRASISVRVVVDEAKSIPLLERLASEPVKDGRDTMQRWAKISLELLRKPSITGYVRDSEGRPLKEVRILISGAVDTNTDTGHDGAYIVSRLNKGATYTITPEISYHDNPGEIRYTLEPASRTISIENGKVTGVNFTATRVRASKNVASASEGAKVKASSAQNDDYDIADTIDEMRFAHVWGYGSGGWNDATPNVFPDWIEVDFGGLRRINWINVFTLPDDYKNAPEPDLEQTFSRYGITDFDVEYWTGRSWRTVPGGAIRGNRNVWRMVSFPVLATNRIRVVVRNALGGASRITEIEAFHVNARSLHDVFFSAPRMFMNARQSWRTMSA